MKKIVITLLALAMIMSISTASFAGSSNGTMTLKATVGTITNFVVSPVWDLRNYDPGDPNPVLGYFVNPIRFDSNPGLWYRITASYSANTTAGGQRNMAKGTDKLQYNIYLDSGYSQRFGDGTYSGDNTIYVSGASNAGGSLYHGVHAKIPAGQSVPIGQYSDTVTYTIIW